jgi:segregation and condensation protein B
VSNEESQLKEVLPTTESVEGTELAAYESIEIEDVEFIEEETLDSVIESVLFASDRPVSLASLKEVFKGTNIKIDKIKKAVDRLMIELAGSRRGVTLEEVPGGYQLRTKLDNMKFLTRTLKARAFRLSGPALEVLSIIAYKQPLIKSEIDEIRGVESGHLLRALMERNLVSFAGKSELPGKPMLYETTRKFLEIFSLRSLKELPTLSQIDELLPEGMNEEESEKTTLSAITESLSEQVGSQYSQGEEELGKITDELSIIATSTEFFAQEKAKQKQQREEEKARNIREAMLVGEEVSQRDRNWLARFDQGGPSASEEETAELIEAAATMEEDSLFLEESAVANDLADIEGEGTTSDSDV